MFCQFCERRIPEKLTSVGFCPFCGKTLTESEHSTIKRSHADEHSTTENSSTLMPAFRIRTEQIPAVLGSQLKTRQRNGLAFGARDMVVKSAVVQSFNLGSSSSGNVKFQGLAGAFGRWSIFGGLGTINQQTTNNYRTDVQIKLADDARLRAFLNYSLPFAVTLSIEPGESLRIFFVKGGLPTPTAEGDFRIDSWTPFAAENLNSGQLIPIMGVPTLSPPSEALVLAAVLSGIVTLASFPNGTLGVILFLSFVSALLVAACVMRQRSYRFGLQTAVQRASEAVV
jgi:hypothetical protein